MKNDREAGKDFRNFLENIETELRFALEFECAVTRADCDRKTVYARFAYELIYFLRTRIRRILSRDLDFVLHARGVQVRLLQRRRGRAHIQRHAWLRDVFFERKMGAVNHNGSESAVDTGFACFKAVAMIEMQTDWETCILEGSP